ncbi:TPA: HAD family hydrolase [Patescibacteria group bacterium]|uniref:D,D-heptose 1,7-bisphosphate phosphatase n=1 Tax=Candidatus Gottesmanbacteria bacterium GW2011_GWA1_43_11 TaxID=1618436 RepID=A0A0G1CFU1_9BACT|nr:MAG: D,D-heptose 1,7-bisphosphate phosphatase [Candidatus Gottesmanbacteria bacterium GW2011_GWA1_43_11]HCS78971.1 HAD family hydrolase [Patescibacteria group bacterium]
MNKALFLDRDGVMNRMVKYPSGWDSPQQPQDVRLVADIEKVISWANANSVLVIEVSNQPGVAKGKMSQETSDAIEEKIHSFLEEKAAIIDKTYICFHHPEAIVPELKKVCDCRKPKPGLLLQAAAEFKLDLENCVLLGDKGTDIETGKSTDCTTIIYIHTEDTTDKVEAATQAKADYTIKRISEVVPIINNLFRSI